MRLAPDSMYARLFEQRLARDHVRLPEFFGFSLWHEPKPGESAYAAVMRGILWDDVVECWVRFDNPRHATDPPD